MGPSSHVGMGDGEVRGWCQDVKARERGAVGSRASVFEQSSRVGRGARVGERERERPKIARWSSNALKRPKAELRPSLGMHEAQAYARRKARNKKTASATPFCRVCFSLWSVADETLFCSQSATRGCDAKQHRRILELHAFVALLCHSSLLAKKAEERAATLHTQLPSLTAWRAPCLRPACSSATED